MECLYHTKVMWQWCNYFFWQSTPIPTYQLKSIEILYTGDYILFLLSDLFIYPPHQLSLQRYSTRMWLHWSMNGWLMMILKLEWYWYFQSGFVLFVVVVFLSTRVHSWPLSSFCFPVLSTTSHGLHGVCSAVM